MTEACSGRTGDFSAVRWYEVPGSLIRNGEAAGGYWSSSANQIVMQHDLLHTGWLVRPEMLHAQLRLRSGHPREQFLGACAGLVECNGACAENAGAWHPATPYVTVPTDSMEVATELRVEPPERDGDHWVTLRSVVRNPTGRAVFVVPPSFGLERSGFAYDVRGPKGSISTIHSSADSSRFFFAPRETKEFVFEFLGADTDSAEFRSFLLPPGEYRMRAGYGGTWGEFQSASIVH
jgi:hypothetical protein